MRVGLGAELKFLLSHPLGKGLSLAYSLVNCKVRAATGKVGQAREDNKSLSPTL